MYVCVCEKRKRARDNSRASHRHHEVVTQREGSSIFSATFGKETVS